MSPLDQYPIPHSQVAGRTIDDEAVLVLSETGDVEVLNAVGARIWELADGTRTVNQIISAIEGEYSVNRERAEADVLEFVGQLAAEQIIVMSDAPRM
jgi:hypothetical protein